MNFFQLQNKLFYSKKTDAGELDAEGEQAFVPFLFNRWLSFYNNNPNLAFESFESYLFIKKETCCP